MVGDGSLRGRLEQFASDRDYVTFTGTLPGEELVKWYEMSEVLSLPSACGPSLKVLNEAMNFENVCIVSDRVGARTPSCETLRLWDQSLPSRTEWRRS